MTAGPPDPATNAVRALQLADRARRGGRFLMVLRPVSRPLVAWGLAWMADAMALRLLPRTPALVLAYVIGAAALLTSVFLRPPAVRSPWARAAARSWWALLLASTVLIWVLTPLGVPLPALAVVMGVVWGLGILLYGVAGQERVMVALGLVLVLLPVPLTFLLRGFDAVFAYGLAGGAAMLGVGLWMTARRP